MQAEERFVKVAVAAPLFTALTYKTREPWAAGSSVIVPLGKRHTQAVILGEGASSADFIIKDIVNLNESRPPLDSPYLKWFEWLADYYVHPVGLVMELAFPPLNKKSSKRTSKKSAVVKKVDLLPAPNLTQEQSQCIANILNFSEFETHLLHGVTGSGKTEVYLRLLEETLTRGQRGLVLVPEIALTPQLISRFAARFGDKIAVLHSQLTDRERTNQWWSIYSGDKKILIGARSALFCPVPNLGLIVVDEEHEPGYKQEEKLRYNARDSAIMLAKILNIPIVLGSATPSLESWHNAQAGRYKLHVMPSRVSDRKLPSIEIIDLRNDREAKREKARKDLPHWLSEKLHENIIETLSRREQVALFLNRRGIAPTILCSDCGYVYRCPNCAISLTLHGQKDLVCHYCDFTMLMQDICPSCQIGEPKSLGLGTEQIEQDMIKFFPGAIIARADRDEITSRETLEDLITKMERHEIDILVGTQMIAKGLDFTKLTLVGLILADVGFNIPDFRSTERSFQLLTQMSGRAGRHVPHGGKVIIQTYNPEHTSLEFAKTADFSAYANHELAIRKELLYPPFGKLAAFRVIARTPQLGINTAEKLARRGEALKNKYAQYSSIQILGPTEAPLAKLRGKYRFHLLLKAPSSQILSSFCRQILGDSDWVAAGTKVQVDVDPINLL